MGTAGLLTRQDLAEDGERSRTVLEHGDISLFELSKFASHAIETEEQRWLKFFKDGVRLDADHLPDWMQTTEMRQAMSTVKQFSEKERAYPIFSRFHRPLAPLPRFFAALGRAGQSVSST